MRHLHPDPIQAAETLAVLLEKEAVYAKGDYLADCTLCDHGLRVSANDRLLLVDWMYSVVDHCGVSLRLRGPNAKVFFRCRHSLTASIL